MPLSRSQVLSLVAFVTSVGTMLSGLTSWDQATTPVFWGGLLVALASGIGGVFAPPSTST